MGKIRKEDITGLGDVAAGKAEGRHDDKEKVIFIMDGMPIEDLAWGYTIYRNALEQGHWKATESLGRLDVGQKVEGRKRRGDSGP